LPFRHVTFATIIITTYWPTATCFNRLNIANEYAARVAANSDPLGLVEVGLGPLAATDKLLLASGTLFAWAYMPKVALAEGRDPRFLAIVLRGALDGLATVAPVGDPNWTALRGDNALTMDGKTPALKLNDFFALNPAMPNLHRMFAANEAIIVHAAATPYRERSHFDGQDVLESGLTKPASSDSGWLNRALAGLAPGAKSIRTAARPSPSVR
jgi:uncharacterized protein (DUF1501 family)